MTLPMLLAGGVGTISVLANALPNQLLVYSSTLKMET